MHWEGHVYLSVELDVSPQQFRLLGSKHVSWFSSYQTVLICTFTANCLFPKLLLSMSQVKKQNYFIPPNPYTLSPEMSFYPQHTSFDILKYWKWDFGFQGLVLKNNARCSLILRGSGVHYIRGKNPYFTLKMNIHISDEKFSPQLKVERREPSELSVL